MVAEFAVLSRDTNVCRLPFLSMSNMDELLGPANARLLPQTPPEGLSADGRCLGPSFRYHQTMYPRDGCCDMAREYALLIFSRRGTKVCSQSPPSKLGGAESHPQQIIDTAVTIRLNVRLPLRCGYRSKVPPKCVTSCSIEFYEHEIDFYPKIERLDF